LVICDLDRFIVAYVISLSTLIQPFGLSKYVVGVLCVDSAMGLVLALVTVVVLSQSYVTDISALKASSDSLIATACSFAKTTTYISTITKSSKPSRLLARTKLITHNSHHYPPSI